MKYLSLILFVVFSSTVFASAVLKEIFPIRIMKGKSSERYLVVLSTKHDWLDRSGAEGSHAADYVLSEVVLLWGKLDQMERFVPTDVQLVEEGAKSSRIVNLRQVFKPPYFVDKSEFLLPSHPLSSSSAWMRVFVNNRVVFEEEFITAGHDDKVRQLFETTALRRLLAADRSVGQSASTWEEKPFACGDELTQPAAEFLKSKKITYH